MYSSGDLIGLDCCCDECAQGHLGLQVFEELKYLLYSLFIVEVLESNSSVGYGVWAMAIGMLQLNTILLNIVGAVRD